MEQNPLYSDPYDPQGELDKNPTAGPGSDPHRARVRGAFDTWHRSVADKVGKDDEERMLGIRDAVENRDTARAQKHLADTREHSGWLYEELMKHPEISAIMRELSIMGF